MTTRWRSSRTPLEYWPPTSSRSILLVGVFLGVTLFFLVALGISLLIWNQERAIHLDSAPDFLLLAFLTLLPWLFWLRTYSAMMSSAKRGEMEKPVVLKLTALTLFILLFTYIPLAITLNKLYWALHLANPFSH